jgi:hypothetical protein
MSDQKYPDGEFAKQATVIANLILSSEGKLSPTRQEFLTAVADAVSALQGFVQTPK